jgi:hypothetical protein
MYYLSFMRRFPYQNYLFLFLFTVASVFLKNNQSVIGKDTGELIYEDKIYNPDIKTVNLYVNKGYLGAQAEPAVINIREPFQLMLEFDELYEDARYFQANIIHCNWDWTPSQLKSIEYLDIYNEFEISQYEYSLNTKIPYTHYRFLVPKVILPGNYLLVVYGRDDPEDLALTKRFIVYDPLVNITPSIQRSSGIQERRSHQQIDFTISYAGLEIFNPQSDIKVVIRKNQSWKSAITNLKPTILRELDHFLEYRHFNLENNFYGGNEYRFFDLNSVRAPGRNVDRVIIKDDRIDAFLLMDKSRVHEFYGQWQDYNGGYFISNIDGIDPTTEAEYVYVHFFLESEQSFPSDVYLYGKISHYNLLPEFKMKYQSELGGYRADLLLKQGWYDYIYYTPDDPWIVEGSHFETRNEYEILVYYLPQGKISEYLIGYISFNANP